MSKDSDIMFAHFTTFFRKDLKDFDEFSGIDHDICFHLLQIDLRVFENIDKMRVIEMVEQYTAGSYMTVQGTKYLQVTCYLSGNLNSYSMFSNPIVPIT